MTGLHQTKVPTTCRRLRGSTSFLSKITSFFWIFSSSAYAHTYQSLGNQRNVLPGGRAALLGGAFEAVADDSSACFYNPAGLALIKERRVQLSTTSYVNSSTTYQNAIDGQPFHETSSSFFPNFIGGTEAFGKAKFGYSFVTLNADNIYQQDQFDNLDLPSGSPTSYGRNYQEKSDQTWAGLSFATQMSDRFSMGISGFYYQRSRQLSSYEIVTQGHGRVTSTSQTTETMNTGIAAILGVLWRRESLSLALVTTAPFAKRNHSIQEIRRLEFQDTNPIDTTNWPGKVSPSQNTSARYSLSSLKELNPMTHAIGMAWMPTRKFLLSGTILAHGTSADVTSRRLELRTRTRLDFSFGAELGIGPLALSGGYFTNNSLFQDPLDTATDQPPAIDYTGATIGSSLNFGGFTGYLGGVRQIGHGRAQIRSDDTSIQEVQSQSLTYVIGGKVPL